MFVVDQVAGHGFDGYDKVVAEVWECLAEGDGGDVPWKVWIHGGVQSTMVKFWIGGGDDDVYGVGGSGCPLPLHCQCLDAVVALEA